MDKVKKQMAGLGLSPKVADDSVEAAEAASAANAWSSSREKRVAVAAEEEEVGDVASHPKSSEVKRLIESAMRDNPLFEGLPRSAVAAIVDTMTPRGAAAGIDIIKQGDADAKEFFVLESGSCDVWQHKREWATERKVYAYGPGGSFGELALLYSEPRAATVRTNTPCKLWVAERRVVNAIKRSHARADAASKLALIEGVPMLACMSDRHRRLLADALEIMEFAPGQPITKRADKARRLYIVKEGSVVVRAAVGGSSSGAEGGGSSSSSRAVGAGGHFGEKALLGGGCVADADVVADGKVACYCMGREAFEALLGPCEDVWHFEALRKVPILFALSERQLWTLVRAMDSASLRKGATVFRAGDAASLFYVIKEGVFTCFTQSGKELARLGPGQCFGELALLNNDVRACNVMCLEDAKVLTMSRDAFIHQLGSLATIRHMWRFEALRRVPLFAKLSDAQRDGLAAALEQVTFPKGTSVVTQGDRGSTFYIVESGQLAAYTDSSVAPVYSYGPNDYFGELALLEGGRRRATVRARTECSLLVLGANDFNTLLGPLLPALKEQAAKYGAAAPARLREVSLSSLKEVAVLGAGGFGKVTLVKAGEKLLALKQMSKAYIKAQKLVTHVHREKTAMIDCDSPWLVNLMATLQDSKNIYMLMEVVLGGELFAYLQSRGRPLSESHARFYVASVVLGLQYLHSRNLVYRDLKPENLLIGTDGYVKVADFGFVKKVMPGTRTMTLCGTPEYLAPEIITNSGHCQAADWWAVGVLVFEMVGGLPPFYHTDRMTMYKNAVAGKYSCPAHFSPELRDFVGGLLVRKPEYRLGCGKDGVDEVKQHMWFKGFDWDLFAQRKMAPPYIPKVTNPTDTSNFRAPVGDDVAGGSYRRQPYASTGEFTDF